MHGSAEVVAGHELEHHFADMGQQRAAATLGMWIFLITEVLFFGGMITAYLVYRVAYYDAWKVGSEHMEFWKGTINTVLLLCSSFTMVLAVWASQVGKKNLLVLFLCITILFGIGFEGVKGLEYYNHFREGSVPGQFWHMDIQGADVPHVQLFFVIYFVMTGFHALHLAIGIGILFVLAWQSWKGKFTPYYNNPIEITGLYWHFVDIVWIFLYPLLYLISRKHT